MRKIILCLLLLISFNHFTVRAIEPEKMLSMANEARAYYNTKQYDKAIPIWAQLVDFYENQEPLDYEVYATLCHALGIAYYAMGNMTDAENIYNKGFSALINSPEDVTSLQVLRHILCDLGLVYIDLRSYDKAEEYLAYAKYLYEQNLDMDIAYFSCLNNLANVSLKLKKRL